MRRAARGALVLLVLATALLFLAHHQPVAEAAHNGPEAHTVAGSHAAHGEAASADCAETGAHCWSAKHELALPAPAAVPAVVLPAVPVPAVTRPDTRREPVLRI
ncbi:hypothetical protein DFP74_2379 [Nocardiopsis sp. Huas11]|uniref:hypothetical protein n=1 Tax=Nocardiopsis sp. Huas11 TaxID=2183912 RepID=UPI000EABF52E|nr:hypothetical protein [Nocardiopsis sp. Huas11]RKS06734.1 hypothetical protein DFP74_2379 [Nocardiopsis sp. Huas11]